MTQQRCNPVVRAREAHLLRDLHNDSLQLEVPESIRDGAAPLEGDQVHQPMRTAVRRPGGALAVREKWARGAQTLGQIPRVGGLWDPWVRDVPYDVQLLTQLGRRLVEDPPASALKTSTVRYSPPMGMLGDGSACSRRSRMWL